MKELADVSVKGLLLFKSCLVSAEYPGIESSTKYVFDRLGVDYFVSGEQSCCTGLGHYFDLIDQMTTTAIAARNFAVAKREGYTNITTMCATCYAINKKACSLLNNNRQVISLVNTNVEAAGLDDLKYEADSFDEVGNFNHVVEVLAKMADRIGELSTVDFSNVKIAAHHACHYYKIDYEDVAGNPEHPDLIDRIAQACSGDVVEWYEDRTLTCGAGFSQRYVNREMSLKATHAKLESLKRAGVKLVLHMCPNCQVQYDRYQPVIEKEFGEEYDMVHMNIAQFTALALGGDPWQVCGFQTHSVDLSDFIGTL
jgi:heterodisulfide reductase subunit B